MADREWQRKFEEPISLPDGRARVTLHDAYECIANVASSILIRTVIANRVETAFADNQDLHEPGVFFSRDRVLNVPPFRGAVRD